jgi:hypothetical protein
VYSLALDTATKRLTRGVRRPYSHSALGFAGTLENAAAVAAPGIPVAVWAQAASGGGFSEVAQTTTDAAGAWTLTAPPGSSRLLRIVAGTNTPAAGPTSSISVHETVIPELSLHVTTPGAGRIVFTGRLRVTPLGRPRPLVFIQTHGPQGWEVVGTPIRVDSRGQYRYTYHSSPLTLDRGFTFRAITPQTTLWQRGRSQVRSAEVH